MRKIHVHKQVAETATALTLELYEQLMSSNEIRAAWRAKHPNLTSEHALAQAFVNKYAGRAIPAARATLAHMLRGPIDERLKLQISRALIDDADLVRGRGPKAMARRIEQNG